MAQSYLSSTSLARGCSFSAGAASGCTGKDEVLGLNWSCGLLAIPTSELLVSDTRYRLDYSDSIASGLDSEELNASV
ncbi:hypothetical protein PF007_g8770 [Phytophthora fragariae]|uniref:Uncharacterized protein n=1 Tax=Phytophthora fragariae TaxID=53985 RepID=A0A6A3SKJ6_9STRA|nr:hypothetical protein PF007_g8770 [Phytophthora fragariae]